MKTNKNFRRKAIAAFLALQLLAAPFCSLMPKAALAADNISIYVNDQLLETDTPAYISGGRTLIPIRMLMENLGAQVEWNGENRTIKVTKPDGLSLTLWADNRLVCYENGGAKTYDVCDVAPAVTEGRTYVPLRLVGNALGLGVEWDSTNRRVMIDSSAAAEKSSFFNLAIATVAEGQTISNTTELSLSGVMPEGAAQIKYLLLDPVKGEGKIVARATDVKGSTTWIPSLEEQGSRILAAAVCDEKGEFLAGAVRSVNVAMEPQIALVGVTSGQTITGPTELSASLNFMASGIIYEFINAADGSSSRTGIMDPQGVYNYNPTVNANGSYALRIAALDAAGNEYYSPSVDISINVTEQPVVTEPTLTLKSFSADDVGIVPVTLSITRNFDVTTTQYWARNISTGQEVLLTEKPWGDYSWFPGPDMAGTWEVYVVVKDTAGKTYTSNKRTAKVPAASSIILSGVGPKQVITGEISISSVANVPVTSVYYEISNAGNGTKAVMGQAADTATKVSWTPSEINEGDRYLQAIATTADGQTIKSEKIQVKIYLGQLYSARPITDKSNFIDYVTPMALATQKENGMSAALQVAQAILETGWGQKVPVDKYTGLFSNNLFGVKGTGNAGSVTSTTSEEYYGTLYRVDAAFRAYKTVQDSWNDHTSVLYKDRYAPYREVMFHSTWGAYALKRCGYATDSGYPGKLIKLIKDYDLDRLDIQKL